MAEAQMDYPLWLGTYISPHSFTEVKGIGVNSTLFMELSDEELAERYPNLVREPLEYVVALTRKPREFAPVAEKLIPLFDWIAAQETKWRLTADLKRPLTTFWFGFSNHRTAVEFKLRFYD